MKTVLIGLAAGVAVGAVGFTLTGTDIESEAREATVFAQAPASIRAFPEPATSQEGGDFADPFEALGERLDRLADLQAQLAESQAALEREVGGRLSALELDSRSAMSISAEPDLAESSEAELEPADEPAAQAMRLARMDGAMYARPEDPGWDDEAAQQVEQGFRQLDPALSQLQSADCHGGICRVEVHHASSDAVDRMFESTEPLVPWDHHGRMETIELANGELTTVVYVTRDGGSFPAGF